MLSELITPKKLCFRFTKKALCSLGGAFLVDLRYNVDTSKKGVRYDTNEKDY
jgi:hypothetical protein